MSMTIDDTSSSFAICHYFYTFDNLYNQRYCEQGHNDTPAKKQEALTVT